LRVVNVHERAIAASAGRVGALIDGLASDDDQLWPWDRWPAMKLDRPLGVGAVGGHGPVRYFVEAYEPGRLARFRFTGPRGFDGYHEYQVDDLDSVPARLRHAIDMHARGRANLTWPMVFGPLHDALIEDSLERAAVRCGMPPQPRAWSPWVRFLRWVLARLRASPRARS
jgi:hypothetical protein